jgi:hypothetical protein
MGWCGSQEKISNFARSKPILPLPAVDTKGDSHQRRFRTGVSSSAFLRVITGTDEIEFAEVVRGLLMSKLSFGCNQFGGRRIFSADV